MHVNAWIYSVLFNEGGAVNVISQIFKLSHLTLRKKISDQTNNYSKNSIFYQHEGGTFLNKEKTVFKILLLQLPKLPYMFLLTPHSACIWYSKQIKKHGVGW